VRGEVGFPVRIRFSELGKVRFISHRDAARAFDRAFRIEALPISLTEGFSPRPQVSFGLALSVGHESVAEYMDVRFAELLDLDALPGRVSAALPEGLDVTGAVALVDRAPALQESVTAVEWELEIARVDGAPVDPEHLTDRIDAALAADELPVTRTRKGREDTVDVRPAIRRLAVSGPGAIGTVLHAEVATQPGARPAELVTVLGAEYRDARVLRTAQWIERGEERCEPLDADALRAVEARAS
jgi:radical SAM-linked protein